MSLPVLALTLFPAVKKMEDSAQCRLRFLFIHEHHESKEDLGSSLVV